MDGYAGAVLGPLPGVAQHQRLARASDPHVHQTPLLFHRVLCHRSGVGEDPLLEAHEEDARELEPLRGVQSHQGDAVASPLVLRLVVGLGQRQFVEEGAEARLLAATHVVLREVEDLGHREPPPLLLLRVGVTARHLVAVGEVGDHPLHERHQRGGRLLLAERGESLLHRLHRLHGGAVQLLDLVRARERLRHRDPLLGGEGEHPIKGRLPHSSRRAVDDPQQRHLVLRILDQLQVGEDVAHLLAVEEAHPADQDVGDGAGAQLSLEDARLHRGAEEDRVVAVAPLPGVDPLADLVDDELRLPDLVLVDRELHRLAAAEVGAQRLLVPLRVVADHPVRGVENRLGGAVVGLQPHHRRLGVVFLEVQDLGDVGAAPGIDRLVVVPHHAHVAVLFADPPHDLVLRPVGVLVLVDEQVLVLLLQPAAHPGVVAQEAHGEEEEVVEVQFPRAVEELLVALVPAPHQLVEVVAGALPKLLRGHQLVLQQRDPALQHRGLDRRLRDVQLPQHALARRELIGGVGDADPRGESDLVLVLAQDLQAEGVEGPHREPLRPLLPHQLRDPLPHLRGRLVGEGHRQHLLRRHAVREQVRDPHRDHPRLPGPGAREHEDGTLRGGDGVALLGIEPVEGVFQEGAPEEGAREATSARVDPPGNIDVPSREETTPRRGLQERSKDA